MNSEDATCHVMFVGILKRDTQRENKRKNKREMNDRESYLLPVPQMCVQWAKAGSQELNPDFSMSHRDSVTSTTLAASQNPH